MRPGGWFTLIISTVFVWSLAIWCYYRILTAAPEEPEVTLPPESLGG